MFRFQDNLPEVYINESRDFQVLARLSDVLFSGIKYDIDTMVRILDATLIKDRMLDLLCTRVGFFSSVEIDAQVLKYIIASFPYILKNKGTEKGIKAAVNAILKAENQQSEDGIEQVLVEVISEKPKNELRDAYTVYIYTTQSIYNKDALAEVFKYVMPLGFTYKLELLDSLPIAPDNKTLVAQRDTLRALEMTTKRASAIRTSNDHFETNSMANRVIGAYDTLSVFSSSDHNKSNDENYQQYIPKQDN